MKIIFALLSLMLLILPLKLQAQVTESDTNQKTNKMFVSVPVTVSDREGHYIPGLTKEDFTVYQDGIKQKITFFAKYNEPLNIVLLLDTSGSARNVIKKIKDAAEDFIELLNPNDQCQVATFDSQVKILNPFTSNHQTLKNSLDKVEINEQGGTLMYSAVRQIAQDSFVNTQGRKVIILLSDGKDFGSAVTKDELLDRLEESDILIYTIFYKTGLKINKPAADSDRTKKGRQNKKPRKNKNKNSPLVPGRVMYVPTEEEIILLERNDEIEAVDSLVKMSDMTAGRFYFSDVPNLKKIFRKITGELTQQYRLGYNSKDAANDKAVHEIDVKVKRPDVAVRTRGKFRTKQL
ncbi:MAG: VWA domain-containing protein [Acidobacteriota bacterium]|nr:VWA domain-containing protein [Acidobacteriota bacterium]